MITYNNADIQRLIDEAAERAAERAAGFYYEKTKHDIDLVLEATGFIKDKLENIVTRNEFKELKSEVMTIKYAVTDTNKDLRVYQRAANKRLARLEKAALNA